MAEQDVMSPTSPTLEALQNRSRDMRRARPPDITILRHENRVPLRPERMAKRESRIGLRSIFSKSKLGKDDKIAEEPSSLKDPSRYMGKRSSLADLGGWPQRLNPSRSEISLLSSPQASIKSPASGTSSSSSRLRQNSNGASQGKFRPQTPAKTGGSITGFEPPPLFKMYPQAIKHATLPTCLTPIDALARLNETKASLLQDDFSRSNLTSSQVDVSGLGSKFEGEKRKKSKAPEWTSKIYALVTSGYLLQYAAEGPFNRLPEKILHLTRDSAAYVSDLIPGRHWVVRVASTTDADGNPSADIKSFRSKLALRGAEKRQVSNMLLVFESPETMDTWLAILRREIESLGGRKKLSETGKPETEDGTAMLKAQTSQRTLVVRDPARFSRIVSQDFSWNQENTLVDPTEERETTEQPAARISESTVDDGSSMISSEGQLLDSLRDSGSGTGSSGSSGSSGNRLSFISSGQRTIVSSAESSPTHSPIRESFSSHGNDYLQKALPPTPEVRPRPNAAAIANRRQSMQTMIPGFDPRLDVGGRPTPGLPATLTSVHESKHQFVPNFSVPHTVSRRYSSMNLSAIASRADQLPSERDGPIRPLRRSPPTKLSISRPLSIVLDQPSPRSPRSPYSPTASTNKGPSTLQIPDSPSMFTAPWAGNTPKDQEKHETPKSQIPKRIAEEAQLRSATPDIGSHIRNNIRASQLGPSHPHPYPKTEKSFNVRPTRSQTLVLLEAPEPIRRPSSSLEMRRASTTQAFGHQSIKHAILLSEGSIRPNRHSLIYPKHSKLPSIEEPAYTLAPPLTCSPKRSAPSLKALRQEEVANQLLAVDISPKSLATRRSMPHLVEGPPPAPPPTCALPPLPGKRSTNIPRSIKT
ncbi:hypothetical protein F4776DRAFT_574791 [Hypoxylon sp. NC0597]|nr:hypothetical protein F4776DRAFT_574791 [Hypoxylon sp. NC0597]